MSQHSSGLSQYYRPGEWNVFCQRCGRKRKSDDVAKQWDGAFVCKEHLDERQPQDFVRGVVDHQAVPYAVPENPDIFRLDAAITGVTTAAFTAGPENLWDDGNTLSVQLVSGALPTTAELDVLNGANLCAVQGASGAWEILQFTIASLTAPSTYALTHLLRGRYGTELAMGAGVGSPFAYIGQADASTLPWLRCHLGVGDTLLSPCHVDATKNVAGDITLSWIRRSRIPALPIDDWSGVNFDAPLDSVDERYEVDVIDLNGDTINTMHIVNARSVVYSIAQQVADFGAVQASYVFDVYQVDKDSGRGSS